MIEVLAPGPLTTVQDAGRPGRLSEGIAPSGALDRPAHRHANRLVGNELDAPVLEITWGGLRLRCDADVVVAMTGAQCPLTADGQRLLHSQPVAVPAGAVLEVSPAVEGMRAYFAVRGGIAVEPVLNSSSCDLLSGLGPPPLRPGDTLAVGTRTTRLALEPPLPRPSPLHDDAVVHVVPGPRDDWFTPDALRSLYTTAWTVSPESNRVGLRLEGPPLERRVHRELPSEGTVRGAIEIPTEGIPLILLNDHPVTIGYPVVGVIIVEDFPLLAQARPGSRLRLTRKDRS